MPSRYVSSPLKRVLDVTVAAALLLVLSPLMIGIWLVLRLSTGMPAIYSQTRHGRGRRPFRILKFRTMRVADPDRQIVQASADDARVTPFGRLLRRTSLDELPQLFNVLKGDMSLVGPRPHAVCHDEAFERMLPRYRERFLVRPGITGLAQVSGARGEIRGIDAIRRRLEFDLVYVAEATLARDLGILVRSVPEIFNSRSAV